MQPSFDPIQPSEAVARGHPDKIADQISDAILDFFISQDPKCKVGCETLVTKHHVTIGGELPHYKEEDLEEVVRNTLNAIGYKKGVSPFNSEEVHIEFLTNMQGKELSKIKGAGDQGISIGYATNETKEMIPKAHLLSREIIFNLEHKRDQGILPFLGLDGKCLVTDSTLLLSFQHSKEISLEELREFILPYLPHHFNKILINPTGTFIEGGPSVDTGLTGRKTVYDSYGPLIPIGGGAFSGKDPTKVDRTGAYFARFLAKYLVSTYKLQSALVEFSFGIGFLEPLSVNIKTVPETDVEIPFSLNLDAMIKLLNLEQPIYSQTAYGGHFGRPIFPWE